MTRESRLVSSDDWVPYLNMGSEAFEWMMLLDNDIHSCQYSMWEYLSVKEMFKRGDFTEVAYLRHNAKAFVCSMCRVGRLFEAVAGRRSVFPGNVRNAIHLAWRKRKAMFDSYTAARNAIEHIDGDVKARTTRQLVNIEDDTVIVSPGKSAGISEKSLANVIEGRNEVVCAIRMVEIA